MLAKFSSWLLKWKFINISNAVTSFSGVRSIQYLVKEFYMLRRHRMLKVWRLITCLQAKKNVIRWCNFNLKFSALKGNYINSKGRKLFHNEFNFNVFVGEITVKKIILPDTYGFYFYCLKIKRNYKWVIIIYCRMYIYDLISNINRFKHSRINGLDKFYFIFKKVHNYYQYQGRNKIKFYQRMFLSTTIQFENVKFWIPVWMQEDLF